MIKTILHRMMQQPFIYDTVQRLVGSGEIRQNLIQLARVQPGPRCVVDIGGGTGMYRDVWKGAQLYVCLDNDLKKLAGFNDKFVDQGTPLLGDATHVPLRDDSVDVVQCTMMSHHLSDDQLDAMIGESFRILKNNGIFFFSDAVWRPESWRGKWLWSVDRGSHPKTQEKLLSMIAKKFTLVEQRTVTIHHTYLFCVGKKLSGHSS